MGTIRFLLPTTKRIVSERLEMAYMSGLDGVPILASFQCQENSDGNGLEFVIDRDSTDSGKVYFPCRTNDKRIWLIPTGTVVERDKPYRALLELARGAIDRLRNQQDFWARCGFSFSQHLIHEIQTASTLFCNAACLQEDGQKCDTLAEQAVELAIDLMEELSDAYIQQVIELRQEQTTPLQTLLGGAVGPDESEQVLGEGQFESLFNTTMIRIDWRKCEPVPGQFNFTDVLQKIDALRAKDLKIAVGPIVRLDDQILPDFILDATEFDYVRRRVRAFVTESIRQMGPRVDLFSVFGGLNATDEISLPGDYRLRLAIDAIEAAREQDTQTPVLIGFDQPWCESHQGDAHLSPLQAADAVARADLNLSGFLLEINWGIHPSGTAPRDPLQLHTFFDLWSQFDLPLLIELSIPSGSTHDAKATRPDTYVETWGDDIGPEIQQKTAQALLYLLLGRPFVQGVFWSQLIDASPHRFRHSGLFDQAANEKPAATSWKELRREYLD